MPAIAGRITVSYVFVNKRDTLFVILEQPPDGRVDRRAVRHVVFVYFSVFVASSVIPDYDGQVAAIEAHLSTSIGFVSLSQWPQEVHCTR